MPTIRAPGQSWSEWFWSGASVPAGHELQRQRDAEAEEHSRPRTPAELEAGRIEWNALCDELGIPNMKQEPRSVSLDWLDRQHVAKLYGDRP